MFETVAAGSISNLSFSEIALAIGGLGTAAYGVVDVTKGFGGGISNRGFGDIRKVVSKLIPVKRIPPRLWHLGAALLVPLATVVFAAPIDYRFSHAGGFPGAWETIPLIAPFRDNGNELHAPSR